MSWHLYQLKDGAETFVGTFSCAEGRDVWASDMEAWLVENIDDYSPDDYEWDGDSESVAIMATRDTVPDYRFEWHASVTFYKS